MRYLLDTHIFIWAATEPEKLSEKVVKALESPENTLFLSVASIWEMQIKTQLRKLRLPLSLPDIVFMQQQSNDIQILPVEPSHIYHLENLPFHHRDPFDRMLIAQSVVDELILVSKDPEFSKYSVNCLW
jgi:PIN domain nuclease of toxin-antitoxin system